MIDRPYTMFTPNRLAKINSELSQAKHSFRYRRSFRKQFQSNDTPTLTSISLYRFFLFKNPSYPPLRRDVACRVSSVPHHTSLLSLSSSSSFKTWYYSHLRHLNYIYHFGHITRSERNTLHRILKIMATPF